MPIALFTLFLQFQVVFPLFAAFSDTISQVFGDKFHDYRVLADALDFVPRDDRFLFFPETEKPVVVADDDSDYPSVLHVHFKLVGTAEFGSVADIYDLFFAQIGGTSIFHNPFSPFVCSRKLYCEKVVKILTQNLSKKRKMCYNVENGVIWR